VCDREKKETLAATMLYFIQVRKLKESLIRQEARHSLKIFSSSEVL
jgi:hypothetical protein